MRLGRVSGRGIKDLCSQATWTVTPEWSERSIVHRFRLLDCPFFPAENLSLGLKPVVQVVTVLAAVFFPQLVRSFANDLFGQFQRTGF